MRHANISIFVPHVGCPHRCSFCDQNAITGTAELPSAADVHSAVETAKASKGYRPSETEIAFFGGSFTAIDANYRRELLDAAYTHVLSGEVGGIRLSTRPDAIDADILDELSRYGVTSIELGAQSMDDAVLVANGRGHTVDDVVRASRMIKKTGFSLGLQMMTGLYGSTREKDIMTAERFIELAPDTVRIYPTIIIKGTRLGELYESGEYRTDDLRSAVELCSELLAMFSMADIRVIRLGLHTIDEDSYLSGPWHPAFRELCESELYYRAVKTGLMEKGKYIISVNPKAISKMTGQGKYNIRRLYEDGYDCTVTPDAKLGEGECKIIKTEESGK